MGTWSSGLCDNDAAWDWLWGLESSSDLSYIESTFDKVIFREMLTRSKNLGAREAEEAIAAATVLAMLHKNNIESFALPEEAQKWVKSHPIRPSGEILAKAQSALEAILSKNSELLALWRETNDLKKWKAAVKALHATFAA